MAVPYITKEMSEKHIDQLHDNSGIMQSKIKLKKFKGLDEIKDILLHGNTEIPPYYHDCTIAVLSHPRNILQNLPCKKSAAEAAPT